MYVLVRDPRRHREVAQRGRDETNGIERPEPCSRERRRKGEPAVELEIEHATETRWPAPAPARQRTVDPIREGRTAEGQRPRDPRRVPPTIVRSCARGRGDDRCGEASAQRQRIDGVAIIGLTPIV